jgi:hypothetical protein
MRPANLDGATSCGSDVLLLYLYMPAFCAVSIETCCTTLEYIHVCKYP